MSTALTPKIKLATLSVSGTTFLVIAMLTCLSAFQPSEAQAQWRKKTPRDTEKDKANSKTWKPST
jgi:hypothetical protein